VETGVTVELEDGVKLDSWNDFYSWAHGRYHALEEAMIAGSGMILPEVGEDLLGDTNPLP
jgi:hypothetical protein